jgi:hypothetical protein
LLVAPTVMATSRAMSYTRQLSRRSMIRSISNWPMVSPWAWRMRSVREL